ncbi:fasciclin domain-containing protein [Purpureocillium lavendulum]|uniref:Fasciclin domain-containing protein n=1 Tax=Purpureocillium lavendulum TaxID=1247861 RepID=A0AB34FET2_9HYPO|nr:fasciclin domain-containing protein [Purpureocillium lavendulum]
MRFALAAVSGAAVAGAFVIPGLPGDYSVNRQSPLSVPKSHDAESKDEAFWHGRLPSKDSLISSLGETVDRLSGAFDNAVEAVEDARHELSDKLADILSGHDDHNKHHHLTIYELIKHSEYTTKFAKIVDEHPSIVKLLNSTKANHTLFVPTDEAFKELPDHDKPDKEFVEKVLRYHIGLGEYPARRILTTHTLPTTLDESWLGGEPQRLRTSVGFRGVTVNFYSKVVAADIVCPAPLFALYSECHTRPHAYSLLFLQEAKNGIIHAVNHILVPPPMAGRVITLFPSQFSTLLLAYEKTDFVKFIHGVKMTGSTVFAPSNGAFERLGPRANAFLFNTEKGLKYLKALLKYHIAPNATLYSDAFYDKTGSDDKVDAAETEHYDLGTLLGKARVSVDIARLGGFSAIRINGFAHVSVRDGLAKNGVIQVVDKVLIPQHKHHKGHSDDVKDIDVEDLVTRLEPYV